MHDEDVPLSYVLVSAMHTVCMSPHKCQLVETHYNPSCKQTLLPTALLYSPYVCVLQNLSPNIDGLFTVFVRNHY